MLINLVQLDAVLDDGGALDLVAAKTNEGNQEDPHTSTKKCRERGSKGLTGKGLTVSCLAIDNKECVSVEHKVVHCNELE